MKILFLDIDGVVNSKNTLQRSNSGFIGIDPYMSILVDRIKQATGCVIVLSSTWRKDLDGRKEVMDKCTSFIACTPSTYEGRGNEIQDWIVSNQEFVEVYAILDDDTKAMEQHGNNYFQTYFDEGLTQEIADKVIAHLNS